MKIGIFDSGLGGLIVAQGVITVLPQYDYVYLGDTARVPYGDRSEEVIYEFTRQGVEYLFQQDCQLIIIACNTMNAEALRRIQRKYLPAHYPDRRVLGVLIPAAEEAVVKTQHGKAGVIATQATINSKAYIREIQKLNSAITVLQQATPLLVPLVENNALKYAGPILDDYLQPLLDKHIDTLVLGCTHYPFFKQQIQEKVGADVNIVVQNELIPAKLADYLQRHDEIVQKLSQNSGRQFSVTDITPATRQMASHLFGYDITLEKIVLK